MKKNDHLKQQIRTRYTNEDSEKLAKDLGISIQYLRVLAKRLHLKKGVHTITNEIVNNRKLCPCCNKILSVEKFNKDKYQPNNLDYYCRSCRNRNKTKLQENKKNTTKISKENQKVSMAFNKKKTRNPVVIINNISSLKCKSCNKYKSLDEFHKDNANLSGHKNFCKECIKNKKQKNI